jgi:hypothetical protein
VTNRVTPLWYNRDITNNNTKENKMAYVAYETLMIKDTPTGMRYLVRHNTYGKYIICSSVSETGNSITSPETTGQYDYVMKKWEKIVGKYVPVTYNGTKGE